jgi:FdhD protein
MLFDTELERDGFQQRTVVRHQGQAQARTIDRVVEEMPVALVFNGVSQAVMMATPRDLEAFALGFALSEGVVDHRNDIYDLVLRESGDGAEVELTICQEAFMRLKDKRRTLAGRSGCGVCGVDSLAQLDLRPPRITAPALEHAPAPAVARAARELTQHQSLMHATGGVHAAAWCRPDGAVVHVFEDVGRHNALDKLIGHLARQGEDMARGFVFLSSRASYELVRKAARMQIPMLATISAPSTLAIDIAERAGVALVSFCREDGCVQYA